MLLGIDFGTTKSVVAAVQARRPKVIPDVYEHQSMPSVVLVAPDQSLHVGWDAVTHPQRYAGKHFSINSIKRMIGKAGEATWGSLRTYPQEVSALILAALKIQAETYLQQDVTDVVIAVPAHFDINQRWATMQAAEIAGLKAVRLVNEATAALLAWVDATRRGGHGVGLVFDFGGGTLDVSIVEYGEGVYEVKTTAGDGLLGGDDFDQVIIDHCLRVMANRLPGAPQLTPNQELLLRESAKRAKEDLSSTSRAEIHLAGFMQDRTRYHDLDLFLERSEFERLCAPLLARAKATIWRALDDTKGTRLDHVLLIGGMSRVPCVHALVREATGLAPTTSADPLFCVAQGASLCAGVLVGDVKDTVLLDVIPETYGVATKGGRVVPMIPRNTTIPTRKSETFTTTEDNQTELSVEVVREEGDRDNQPFRVGTVHLSGIPLAKAGVPEIEVTFDIAADHVISVSARDMGTGREVGATLQSPYRLNPAQVRVLQTKVAREMARVRERFQTESENALDLRAQDGAQAAIRAVEEVIGEPTCPLAPDQVSLLSAGVALLRDYLHRHVPRGELNKLAVSILQALERESLQCVERALRTIAAAPEYTRWADQIRHAWHDPVQVAASLVSLRESLREPADRFRGVLQFGGLRKGRAWLKASMAALRVSSGELFCLACLLDDSVDPQFDTHGLIEVRDENRGLLVTVVLRDLTTLSSPARRREAASALFRLWKGTRCFLLLQYLIDEKDPDVAAWLTRCLEEIPQGGWVEFILAHGGEKQQAVLGNVALLNLVQQDVLTLLQSGQVAQGEAAVRVIRELRLTDRLPELPGLLQANLPDTVKVSIIKLLGASPREELCVPLLQCLAHTSPEVRYTAVMALEQMRHMMDKDCARLFTIAEGLLVRRESMRLQDKLFLWNLKRRRGEFQNVVQALRTSWRGVARG